MPGWRAEAVAEAVAEAEGPEAAEAKGEAAGRRSSRRVSVRIWMTDPAATALASCRVGRRGAGHCVAKITEKWTVTEAPSFGLAKDHDFVAVFKQLSVTGSSSSDEAMF